jgi:hypothetical protein
MFAGFTPVFRAWEKYITPRPGGTIFSQFRAGIGRGASLRLAGLDVREFLLAVDF